jgi:hypothetical protein
LRRTSVSSALERCVSRAMPTPKARLWVGYLLVGVGGLSVPVAIGIAILRYRLYDIDVVINRTLVYGSLTAILIALYFVGIVVLQRLFVLLTGQQCPELEPLCIAHRHKDALGQIRNTPQEADTGGGVARSSDPRSLQNVRPSCHRCA